MNEKREVAITLSNVTKQYKLGEIGYGTLQQDLQSWWAKVRGKEDPNRRIDSDERLVGETFMALNGVDLTVYKGEALGIIGANGAGKMISNTIHETFNNNNFVRFITSYIIKIVK